MDKDINSVNDKYPKEKWIVEIVPNDKRICKDCIYRNVKMPGICKMYPTIKPNSVFDMDKCRQHKTQS